MSRTVVVLFLIFSLSITLDASAGPCSERSRFQSSSCLARQVGSQVANQFISKNRAGDLDWDWGPAIFLYGLARLARALPPDAAQRYVNYLASYHDRRAHEGVPRIDRSDRCPPALSALALWTEFQDDVGLASALSVAGYLNTEERNSLGALNHLGSDTVFSSFYPKSIWVDSLMMYAVFAAQWGSQMLEPGLLDFGIEQPLIFASKLQDPESGLFRHAWNLERERPIPEDRVFWGRGNGWAAASIVDILDVTPRAHPKRGALIEVLRRLARGAALTQLGNGLWETVMNGAGASYAETSGTALLAYAMARGAHRGYLDYMYKGLAKKAFRAILAKLERTSAGYSMPAISGPTNPSGKLGYSMVPVHSDLPYGIGAFLLLASEFTDEDLNDEINDWFDSQPSVFNESSSGAAPDGGFFADPGSHDLPGVN